jgi:hypothetical protein
VTAAGASAPSRPAADFLARRQKRYPPFYATSPGVDRARQIYRALKSGVPQDIRKLFDQETAVIGEVGRNAPDVSVRVLKRAGFRRLARSAYVIEFNSGMMDFVYAVARTLAGLMVRQTTSGPSNTAPLQMPDVVAQTAALFARRARLSRWPWSAFSGRIEHPTFPITKSVHDWIETLTTCAEMFMVAHEVGHVARREGMPPFSSNEEECADALAMSFYLPAIFQLYKEEPRLALAGAMFAVNIFEGLQRLGVHFSDVYLPQVKRVELVKHFVLALGPSPQWFHEIFTIAVAYQDMLEDVVNRLDPGSKPPAQFDRVLVRIISEIEEVVRGRLKMEKLIDDLGDIQRRVPASLLEAVARTLCAYYVTNPSPVALLHPAFRKQMGEVLVAAIPRMPGALRDVFKAPCALEGQARSTAQGST